MKTSLQVKGLKELQRRAITAVKALEGPPFLKAMRRATLIVTASAKRNAPANTGRLRASIIPRVETEGNNVRGIVGSNVAYAPYMELGTGTWVGKPPHFPPPSALATWAKRHGFKSGYAVAISIFKKGGLRPRKYLQRALEDNSDKIKSILIGAATKIAKGK